VVRKAVEEMNIYEWIMIGLYVVFVALLIIGGWIMRR
jgi:hypothetical protein